MEQDLPPPAVSRPPRCNADYRWTVPKALAFLEALAESGRVAAAAQAVGMSRQAGYRLRDKLAGGPLGDGFALAMAAGKARRRRARPRSRWAGPGLDALSAVKVAGSGKVTSPPAKLQTEAQSNFPGHRQQRQHPAPRPPR